MELQWSNIRSVGSVRWSHRLIYDCSMLEYKVIKFPPWLFSMMWNTAMSRKNHAPDSHQWKPLPWFFFLRQGLWTIQATSGATVEWQLESQWSNSRSAGKVKCSHILSYNRSMLEYKGIKFPPWLFSTMSNTAIIRKTHAWQSLMKSVTLSLPREAMTVNNTSNIRSDSGVTDGVTVE